MTRENAHIALLVIIVLGIATLLAINMASQQPLCDHNVPAEHNGADSQKLLEELSILSNEVALLRSALPTTEQHSKKAKEAKSEAPERISDLKKEIANGVYNDLSELPEHARNRIINENFAGVDPGEHIQAWYVSDSGFEAVMLGKMPEEVSDELSEIARIAVRYDAECNDIEDRYVEEYINNSEYNFSGSAEEAREYIRGKGESWKISKLSNDERLYVAVDLGPLIESRADYALKRKLKESAMGALSKAHKGSSLTILRQSWHDEN